MICGRLQNVNNCMRVQKIIYYYYLTYGFKENIINYIKYYMFYQVYINKIHERKSYEPFNCEKF